MKAIQTKFLGPTNFRGSRVKASDTEGNSITLDWDHALDASENHIKAAYALCAKMHWDGTLIQGSLRDSYVHVFRPKKEDL